MKYAKKFRVVPYTTETPALSQIATTFNTALTTKTYPDEKVKIYNQALSKLKELKSENTPSTPTVENKNYDVSEEIEGEDERERNIRIAKEIAELEKRNAQDISSKTLTDYSHSDKVSKYKRKKPQFDNEKFIKLLDELIENSNLTKSKVQEIHNLLPTSYGNITKNLISTPAFENWTMGTAFNSKIGHPSTIQGQQSQNFITNLTENGSEINKKLFTTPNKTNRKSINQNYKLTNIPENSINDSKINNQNSYLDIAKKKNISKANTINFFTNETSIDKSLNESENVIDGMYDYLNKNNLVKDSPLPKINKDPPKIARVVLNDIAKDIKYVKFFTNLNNNLNLDKNIDDYQTHDDNELDYDEPLTKKQKKGSKSSKQVEEKKVENPELIKLKIVETKQKKAKKDLDKTIQQSNIIEKRTRVQNIPNKSRSNIPRNTPRRK